METNLRRESSFQTKKKGKEKKEKKSEASLHTEIFPSLSKESWNFFTKQTVWWTSGSGDRYFRCFYGFLSSLRAFPPPIASVWWLFQRFYRPAFEFYDVVAGFYITTTGGSSSMSNDSIYTSLYRNISTEKRALTETQTPFQLLLDPRKREYEWPHRWRFISTIHLTVTSYL